MTASRKYLTSQRALGCEARQYSDQMVCTRCGLTWDTNDADAPKCAEDASAGQFEK